MPECEAATAVKFKLYSVPDLLAFSEPGWLIEKLFPVESLLGLYGPSGHGKSFLALDWALSIARGGEWLGRSVRQGPVVYIAAEGGRSIRRRVAAWMDERGCPTLPGAFFLLEGVQIREQQDVELLAGRIDELEITPVLIVVDTLARCFVGGDENSAQEMGEFIGGLDWLKQKTGAAVMVLHHTGKKAQEMERGSTALRAAADVMIHVAKKNEQVIVRNNKQKDDEQFKDIHLRLKQVAVGTDTSCVLEAGTAGSVATNPLSSGARETLRALWSSGQDTMTTAEWATAVGIKERTFHSHRKELLERGHVEVVRRGVYRVTESGCAELETAATASHLHLVMKQ
jgi:hypothetical protein